MSKVLKSIYEKENGGQAINPKLQEKDLKSYFGTVLPEYDREKVYVSDIKKVLIWYNILNEKQLLVFTEEEPAGGTTETTIDETDISNQPEAETKSE